MKEQIVICMPLKNAEKTVKKSVFSVLKQIKTKRDIFLLIGNDNSSDNSKSIIKEIVSQNTNVVLLNVNFGKTYLNRNYLNSYARNNYPNCVLIGRLDADDTIYSKTTFSEIEALYDKHNFDILMCGNKQIKNNKVQDWENKPSKKLLDDNFLLNQLFEMTQGNPKAELPSCNTFVRPCITTKYPAKESAEDHWFNVLLLMQKSKLNILIDDQLLYCIYSLDGLVTSCNRKTVRYIQSRKELYKYFFKHQSLKIIKGNWNNCIKSNGLAFHIQNIKKKPK